MTTQLRNGTTVEDPRLDRMVSETTEHLRKYPLTTATMPSSPQPIVAGINWYSAFDTPRPIQVGRRKYHIVGDGDLGSLRGGHATCLLPSGLRDRVEWWDYYDQGLEGRCVEFACLRAMTLLNRKRYDIDSAWHYHEMQRIDEWVGGSYPGASPQYEGTSVRAGLEVMRAHGAIPDRGRAGLAEPDEGIAVYRWAKDWNDVRTVLGVPENLPGVPFLNSWGRTYPRITILADAAGERVLREDGELGVITDR